MSSKMKRHLGAFAGSRLTSCLLLDPFLEFGEELFLLGDDLVFAHFNVLINLIVFDCWSTQVDLVIEAKPKVFTHEKIHQDIGFATARSTYEQDGTGEPWNVLVP